jgi:hypothetical protein
MKKKNKKKNKEQKKPIPLYDPYTGEPNPEYEKLTGKKNPLLENITNSNNILAPNDVNFVLGNRFVVEFPEEMEIKPYLVKSVALPIFNSINNKLYTQGNLILKMREELNLNLPKFEKSLVSEEKITIKINMLDATGVTIKTFCFLSVLGEIIFADLNYGMCELFSYDLKFSVYEYDTN